MSKPAASNRPGLSRDDGSSVVSILLLFTSFFLFIELIALGGRVASIQSEVQAATREAARTATLANNRDDAEDRIDKSVNRFLAARNHLCDLESVTMTTPNGFGAGGTVVVEVKCSVRFGDLTFLPLPTDPTITLVRSAAEPIDFYRSAG